MKAPPQVLRWQQRLAGWMQRQSQHLSRRAKITIWLLFCIVSAGYCGWLVHKGLNGSTPPLLSIEPIHVPQHTGKTGDAGKALISRLEYERIHRFKNYMDSLARSPSGKVLFDSLTRQRPWLMDSVLAIERLYHAQKQP